MAAHRLTAAPLKSILPAVAAKSATGIGVPQSRRTTRPSFDAERVFCARSLRAGVHLPFCGGRCAGAARLAGSFGPVCQPRAVRHPV